MVTVIRWWASLWVFRRNRIRDDRYWWNDQVWQPWMMRCWQRHLPKTVKRSEFFFCFLNLLLFIFSFPSSSSRLLKLPYSASQQTILDMLRRFRWKPTIWRKRCDENGVHRYPKGEYNEHFRSQVTLSFREQFRWRYGSSRSRLGERDRLRFFFPSFSWISLPTTSKIWVNNSLMRQGGTGVNKGKNRPVVRWLDKAVSKKIFPNFKHLFLLRWKQM